MTLLNRAPATGVTTGSGAHWALNALGVLFGLVAWRLDTQE